MDLARAGRSETHAAYSTLSNYWNLASVYDEHNARVKEITGADLENPRRRSFGYFTDSEEKRRYGEALRAFRDEGGTASDPAFFERWGEEEYRRKLNDLAAKMPERRAELLPETSFTEMGYAKARDATAQAEAVAERGAGGASDWVARNIVGGVWAAAEDPVNWLTVPFGFSTRTGVGAKGLLMAALKAGTANAAVEASLQPFVQSYRSAAGLDSGFAQAATAVGGAFAFGGALDTAVRGTARLVRHQAGYVPVVENGVVVKYRKRDVEGNISAEVPADVVVRAEMGDPAAIRQEAEITGLAKDPAVRVALDAMDADEQLRVKPSDLVDDATHAAAVTQTMRHIADPDNELLPVVREGASVSRLREIETDSMKARADLARVVAAVQAQGAHPDLLRVIDTISTKIKTLETEHAAMQSEVMSDELAAAVISGEVPREAADMVATFVANKDIQARVAKDLTERRPDSPEEGRRALAELLSSPDYAPRPKEKEPVVGLDTRALDDPYGPDAVKQVAFLEQQMAEELGIVPEGKAKDDGAAKDFLDAVREPDTAEPMARSVESYRDPDSGAEMASEDVDAVVDMWRYIQEAKQKKPETLFRLLMRFGRLKDENGELTNVLGGKSRHLISGKGMSLDEAALVAYQEGFFTERPDIATFLDAIDNDVRGNHVFRETDYDLVEEWRVAQQMEEDLGRLGISGAKSADEVRNYFRSEAASYEGAGGRAPVARSASSERFSAVNYSSDDFSIKTYADAKQELIRRVESGDYSPDEFDRLASIVADEISAVVARLPDGVSAKAMLTPDGIEGGFKDGNIFVSLLALDPKAIMHHEEIHALRGLGLFTDKEWKLLVKEADKRGVKDDPFLDGKRSIRDVYPDTYGGRFMKDGVLDRGALDNAIDEEAVAYMVQFRANGGTIGRANKIIDRVLQFFERVRNTLSGFGFRTVDDVLRAMETGEISARDPASGSSPEAMYALRTDKGRMKPGAKDRAQNLKDDLAEIEAAFQASGGDERAKLQAKRAALMNAKAEEKALDDLEAFRDERGRSDPAKALMFLVESQGEGAALDMKNLRTDIMNEFMRKADKFIWAMRKGAVSGDLRRNFSPSVKALMKNVVLEQGGTNTKDATAKEIAKGLTEANEWLRQTFNALGGDIGKLEGYIGPQHHNVEALLKAKPEAWIKYMMEANVEIRDADTGAPLIGQRKRSALRTAYMNITTDGAHSREVGQRAGKGATYKRHADHRVIHFKTPEAWIKYQTEFGGADFYASYIGHAATMARDIAALQRFGANPHLVFDRLKQHILKQAAQAKTAKSMYDELEEMVGELTAKLNATPTRYDAIMAEIGKVHDDLDALRSKKLGGGKLSKANRSDADTLQEKLFGLHEDMRKELESGGTPLTPDQAKTANKVFDLMEQMQSIEQYPVKSRDPEQRARRILKRAEAMFKSQMGMSGTPADNLVANFMQGARNLISPSMLVYAPISAITDHNTQIMARLATGMPVARHLASFFKAWTPRDRKAALALNLGLDQAQAAFELQARFLGTLNTQGWTGFVADRSHAFSFLSPMTQAQKTGFGLDFLHWMTTLRDKAYADLAEPTQYLLKSNGFSEADWNTLRAVEPEDANGTPLLTRTAIAEQAGEELAQKYMVMLYRARSKAVIEGTTRGRTLWVSDTQPGDMTGEALRSIAMLKSFPTTYTMLIMGDFYRSLMQGRWMAAASFGTTIFITGALFGALALQLKNILQGRDVEDMTEPKFWGRAFAQAGGAGIYGDFLSSAVGRNGQGLTDTLAGPVYDQFGSVLDLTAGSVIQYAKDEPLNMGRKLTNFARRNTPGVFAPLYVRTAYERMIIDELQKQIDPDAHKSFASKRSNRKRVFGNDFFWPPGQKYPSRGPNLGAAFGN